MKSAERFGRFLARFWPLWLPLLLLFALPPSRPFGRIVSDEIVGTFSQMLTGEGPQSPMPNASAHPKDLDLQLWNGWYNKRRNYSYDYADSRGASDADVAKLRRKFPVEPLLVAPPLQHELGLSSWVEPWYDYRAPTTAPAEIAAELKVLRTAALCGQKLEPDNAFWWVALAQIEWRSQRHDAALRALERAAKCSRYDDYTLALARRLVRARERYSETSFFDKLAIMEDTRTADDNKMANIASVWSAHAVRVRAKGDAARALRWAGALIIIGDLMQRDLNSFATAKAGALWQSEAYGVGYPPKMKGVSPRGAAYFAQFANANGRADLARLTPQLAAHSRKVRALAGARSGRYGDLIWLHRGQLDRWISLLEFLPFMLAANLAYLALWWLNANFGLWRAGGAPSSRRDRVGLGLAMTCGLWSVGLVALWFGLASDGGTLSPLEGLLGSLALFAFFGTPFALALVCAFATLRRHRARFTLPPRIDMELSLSSWARTFLRWLLPLGVMGSIALFVAAWILWLLATWRGWGQVDLLALLPPDRYRKTGSLMWDSTGPTLLVYGGLMCCLSLFIWFGRWRWTVPAALRSLTQGALRWWKESLGVALVALGWLCLLLALLSWPLFSQADARLERALKVGELEVK